MTASCTTMIAHCECSGLLRPSKTNNLFGATPVQRAHLVQKLSLRARPTVTVTTAASTGRNPVRQPRGENVAGEFYVDHTCIGGPLLCPFNHQPRSLLLIYSRQLSLMHSSLVSAITALADCDTCRWMDPATYDRVGNMSAVVRQPQTPHEREKAMQALITCPT